MLLECHAGTIVYLEHATSRVVGLLNQQGVVSILLLAQQGLVGTMQSVVDLTYLFGHSHFAAVLRASGEVKQAISVMKKRSGNHERTIREFKIAKNGISVGPPPREFHGVLTGVPTFRGSEQMLKTK